jgi:excisionase family DNA binding protein
MISTEKDRRKMNGRTVKDLPVRRLINSSDRKKATPNTDIRIKLKDKENYLEISTEAFTLLQKILDFMARGKSITIVPTDESLTTQQAARMLNVSRPHVVKLLEAGEIPFKMVGSHRRIFLKDLEAYEKKIAKKREKQLRFLTKQAQKLDMGY